MKDLACTSGISPNIGELVQLCSGRAVANSLSSVFEKGYGGISFQTINNYYITHSPPLFEKNNNWMNTFEAAQYLRISENNLRVKVSRGEIPVNGKLGRIWRFRRDELDKLLESPCKKENFHD